MARSTANPVAALLGAGAVSSVSAGFLLAGLLLAAAIVLGGGTRSGFLGDVILQLIAIPVFLVALGGRRESRSRGSFEPLFCGLLVLVPLLQIVPLASLIQVVTISRADAGVAAMLSGRPTVSVNVAATMSALLSLLPPVALFLMVRTCGSAERRGLAILLVGGTVASAFLGLGQLSQGPSSPLRFFEETNRADVVGFFANRNHVAALLYCAFLIAVPWALQAATLFRQAPIRARLDARFLLPLVASLLVMTILVSTQAMTRSRAGLGLTMAALVGGYLILFRDRRRGSRQAEVRWISGAIGLGAVIAIQFALLRILSRFGSDPLADARVTFARGTIEAAKAFMPFGSGMGTFTDSYGLFEKPVDALVEVFANRAHNDFLEIWLEAGVLSLGLVAVFTIWFAGRFVAVWRRQSSGFDIDHSLARAASLAVLFLMLHSLVDYPLRTGAMMVIFAMACAFLVTPPADPDLSDLAFAPDVRRRPSKSRREPTAAAAAVTIAAEVQPQTRLAPSPTHWPAEWQSRDGDGPTRRQPQDWPPVRRKPDGTT